MSKSISLFAAFLHCVFSPQVQQLHHNSIIYLNWVSVRYQCSWQHKSINWERWESVERSNKYPLYIPVSNCCKGIPLTHPSVRVFDLQNSWKYSCSGSDNLTISNLIHLRNAPNRRANIPFLFQWAIARQAPNGMRLFSTGYWWNINKNNILPPKITFSLSSFLDFRHFHLHFTFSLLHLLHIQTSEIFRFLFFFKSLLLITVHPLSI